MWSDFLPGQQFGQQQKVTKNRVESSLQFAMEDIQFTRG